MVWVGTREALATAYESKRRHRNFQKFIYFLARQRQKAKIDKNACDLLHGHGVHRPDHKGDTRATLTHPFVCDKKGRPLVADVGKCKNLYKTALRFVSAHVWLRPRVSWLTTQLTVSLIQSAYTPIKVFKPFFILGCYRLPGMLFYGSNIFRCSEN